MTDKPIPALNATYDDARLIELLAAIDRGEDAAMQEIVSLLYPDLKQIAHSQLAGERPEHTLNTTAVVHEAYLRLSARQPHWKDRNHFLRTAARVMRHLLVDHARQRNAAKRGDGNANLPLDEQRVVTADDAVAVLALNDAIQGIADIDPRLEKIIECRYFAGLSDAETAEALGISVRTVQRDWQRARGYLLRAMELDDP